ncbi:hypothetical protein ACFQQB_60060 [Nonomuraea rubra]|uniref:hypothetical protein n=1 Tax=Nonomuraea rubra TaxID=46180 RepID=UPI00361EEAB2
MSENGPVIPLYRLVEEESGTVIITAHEINGFFVESDHAQPEDILIFGSAREPVRLGKDLSDVELRVVNSLGKAIGSYYIGRVGLRSMFESKEAPGGVALLRPSMAIPARTSQRERSGADGLQGAPL